MTPNHSTPGRSDMNRRHRRHGTVWVLGLAVGALVSGVVPGTLPAARAQNQVRFQKYNTLQNEYAQLFNAVQPAAQQQQAEDKLAASLLQFVEEAPKEDLS